jgi:hypothetical protein
MTDLLLRAFNNVLDAEFAEEKLVRDEIQQRGTYWAASEIWKLRRQVKALRSQLSKDDPSAA